jgi:hypothetical protein
LEQHAGHVARNEEMRNEYKLLVEKPRMDIKENKWEGMDWIHLAQGKDQWWSLVYVVMNFRFP